MGIKEYSLAKQGAQKVAPAFRVREFACRDGTDAVMIDTELVAVLQCVREHFGKAVHITSGYRTAERNASVGGTQDSQHLLGRAADFWVEDTAVGTVADYLETLLPGRGGIGRYPKGEAHPGRKTGWVHVDTRTAKARWAG